MSGNLAYHGDDVSAAYIHEKSDWVIRHLVDILQTIEDQDISHEEKQKQIHGYVEAALWDALKIIATTTDSPWDTQDCRLIANCGNAKEGWDAIKYKYSQDSKKPWYKFSSKEKKAIFYQTLLKERTVLKAEIAVRKEFCEKLKPLLKEHRGEARTKINMVMDSYCLEDKCFLRMDYLLDQINMNHISWESAPVKISFEPFPASESSFAKESRFAFSLMRFAFSKSIYRPLAFVALPKSLSDFTAFFLASNVIWMVSPVASFFPETVLSFFT